MVELNTEVLTASQFREADEPLGKARGICGCSRGVADARVDRHDRLFAAVPAADIPDNEFSAGARGSSSRNWWGTEFRIPRSSQQSAIVRERILADFRAYGYDPQVEVTHTLPPRYIKVSRPVVTNILARRSGASQVRPSCLQDTTTPLIGGRAHSDDGVAVAAILEIARMFRAFHRRGTT